MSPEKGHPSFLARVLLEIEKRTVSPSSVPKRIGRRVLLRKGWETARWAVPLVVFGSAAGWFIQDRWARSQNEEEIILLSPEFKRDLKLGPNGEELYFWGPGRIFWIKRGNQATRFVNRTDNLFIAVNHKAFGQFLKEEKINLEKVGSGEFVIDSNVVQGKEEGNFLKGSQNISAFIGANLFRKQKEGESFLKSNQSASLFTREKERFLEKFNQVYRKESLPFSLWREPLR